MSKSAIERFAVNARTLLISEIKQILFELGITEGNLEESAVDDDTSVRIDGRYLTGTQKQQRARLIAELRAEGYEQTIEEIAYTWFNRLVALRFMEVNGYLPTGVRVLSSSNPQADARTAEPDILRQATVVDLNVDLDLVYEYRRQADSEGLYRYLLIKQCNALHSAMPFLFEPIADYTELVFPRNLLAKTSVVRQIVTSIPEEDWKDQVEIVGWLYQYYISEKKDRIYADLKLNKKVSKEDIPAATQLFTPEWIVRYMVENSLGRLWSESHPDSGLKRNWEYYIEDPQQDAEVLAKLDELRISRMSPEDMAVLDPACGSGHILVYAFDLLYEMYRSCGYHESDIPRLILTKNLYGLDIDERAAQLAAFALLMKARQRDRRALERRIDLNICAIHESNSVDIRQLRDVVRADASEAEKRKQVEILEYLCDVYRDAKHFGSLIDVEPMDWDCLEHLEHAGNGFREVELIGRQSVEQALSLLVKQAKLMSRKYDVVVTNPPYMGRRNMNPQLRDYLDRAFPIAKSDLFAAFIDRCLALCGSRGIGGMITQHSWMFLSSYEELRARIFETATIVSMVHLGPKAFEEIGGQVVQSTAFVVRSTAIRDYVGVFARLVNEPTALEKQLAFPKADNRYLATASSFLSIPGSPIAYWASEKVRAAFERGTPLREIAPPRQGLATADNDRFLRLWHEVAVDRIGFGLPSRDAALESGDKWFPYNKGGEFRKWYGNNEWVVNWERDGAEIRSLRDASGKVRSRPQNTDYYFRPGITWTFVSSSRFGSRYSPPGFLFDVGGSSVFPSRRDELYLCAFLCSKLAFELLKLLNPTLNFQVGDIGSLPVMRLEHPEVRNRIDELARTCIELSKADWDSFETSWDFKRHPLLVHQTDSGLIEDAFNEWAQSAEERFMKLKKNEEEINRIFIDIYGLQGEMTPEVADGDITVSKADRMRDIKSLISYAVGCMLGRYSLDYEGLAYAGGEMDWSRYKSYRPDEDGIIPVLDDEYFTDDIAGRFVGFLVASFGEATLDENLAYVAESLGKRADETDRDTIRRYFLNDFYPDHVKTYRKRPIYWLFSSGKAKGFNALVYMHRYREDTVARIRTDYLHELQRRMEGIMRSLSDGMDAANSQIMKRKLGRRLAELEKQMAEIKKYDEVIHHVADQRISIDLDDGVKVNYAKLEKVLAKI